MKRQLTCLLLSLLIVNIASPSRRAEALVGGIATAFGGAGFGIPLMVIGGAGVVGGTEISAVAFGSLETGGATQAYAFVFGVGCAVLGVLALGENAQAALAFAPLSANEADRLGLTSEEFLAYNDQIDEINAVRESVESDLTRSKVKSLEISQALWKQYDGSLSPEAVRGLQKVSDGALARTRVSHTDY